MKSEVICSSDDLWGQWGVASSRCSQSEASTLVLCSAFPGPHDIHNMLMTLTLLIMAKQPNLKPCEAQR
ncbi:hypothetical protein OYC64_009537 [Pagothenia borchgrevinki]|uniref:Uncharacterized protein n=1 Tax=Pagothenia borchgrevinki TaxID=8213 RepID=A0ABD2H6C1_PAGBO